MVVVSGPGAGLVATPSVTGYTFSQLPWGTYTVRASEQGGTSQCFLPADATLTVTAQDVANGRTTVVRDFAWTRRRGTIAGRVQSLAGGSRSGIPQIVT